MGDKKNHPKHIMEIDTENRQFVLDGHEISDCVLEWSVSGSVMKTVATVTISADIILKTEAEVMERKI